MEILFTMSWNDLEDKAVVRYMRKKMSGGRSTFALAVDYVVLRLLVFVASYFLFLPQFERRATSILLAAITLALAMLILHMANEIWYARFYKNELRRVRKQLLQDRLLLLDMQTMIPLISALCPEDTTPVVLQRALPIDANQLLALVRTHPGCGTLHVFSCSEYDETAKSFAARTNGALVLHAPEILLAAAEEGGKSPSDADAIRSIHAQILFQKQQRRKRKPIRDYVSGGARKYSMIALLLMGLSFVTDYALYYRMLAAFCMGVAARGMWKNKADAGK